MKQPRSGYTRKGILAERLIIIPLTLLLLLLPGIFGCGRRPSDNDYKAIATLLGSEGLIISGVGLWFDDEMILNDSSRYSELISLHTRPSYGGTVGFPIVSFNGHERATATVSWGGECEPGWTQTGGGQDHHDLEKRNGDWVIVRTSLGFRWDGFCGGPISVEGVVTSAPAPPTAIPHPAAEPGKILEHAQGVAFFTAAPGSDPGNPERTGKVSLKFDVQALDNPESFSGEIEFFFTEEDFSFISSRITGVSSSESMLLISGSGRIIRPPSGEGSLDFLVVFVVDKTGINPDISFVRVILWKVGTEKSVVFDTQFGEALSAAPSTTVHPGLLVLEQGK